MSTSEESTPRLQGYISDTVLIFPIKVFRNTDIPGTAGIGMKCKPWSAKSSHNLPAIAVVTGQRDSRLGMPVIHLPTKLFERESS